MRKREIETQRKNEREEKVPHPSPFGDTISRWTRDNEALILMN